LKTPPEVARLMPMLNSGNNEELILAMEQTGTRTGPEGFKKDKSGEKLAETEEDKLEYRTDGTDAFDTLYIGMNKFPHLVSSKPHPVPFEVITFFNRALYDSVYLSIT